MKRLVVNILMASSFAFFGGSHIAIAGDGAATSYYPFELDSDADAASIGRSRRLSSLENSLAEKSLEPAEESSFTYLSLRKILFNILNFFNFKSKMRIADNLSDSDSNSTKNQGSLPPPSVPPAKTFEAIPASNAPPRHIPIHKSPIKKVVTKNSSHSRRVNGWLDSLAPFGYGIVVQAYGPKEINN